MKSNPLIHPTSVASGIPASLTPNSQGGVDMMVILRPLSRKKADFFDVQTWGVQSHGLTTKKLKEGLKHGTTWLTLS